MGRADFVSAGRKCYQFSSRAARATGGVPVPVTVHSPVEDLA